MLLASEVAVVRGENFKLERVKSLFVTLTEEDGWMAGLGALVHVEVSVMYGIDVGAQLRTISSIKNILLFYEHPLLHCSQPCEVAGLAWTYCIYEPYLSMIDLLQSA